MGPLAGNPLVRAVARIPTTVQRKLLAAFAIVVLLLVAIGVLGIGVLSQSNDRVATLGLLPKRVASYAQLKNHTVQLSQQLAYRHTLVTPCAYGAAPAGGGTCFTAPGFVFHPDSASVAGADSIIEDNLLAIGSASDVARLGFVAPPEERSILMAVHSKWDQLSSTMIGLYATGLYFDNSRETVEAQALDDTAGRLVSVTETNAANLITQNNSAYLGSQHLFIGVAAGSAALALLLGVILAWALVEPIKKTRARLAAIGSGDFSAHVDVPNRDELGALAADVNGMSDELGRLYREVENASRHKSEFLANMSHELRTPLNAVIGFSEVLQDRLFGELNDKQAEYVADIHSSGQHLLALINDILDLSKIEAGSMELHIGTVALAEVLESSVLLMRERATRQRISLGLEVDPSIGVIEADERKLKQVLFNLLSNALKFTGSGGHVKISARANPDDVAVSVRDDGVGIAEADQIRIFEEFQQAGTSHMQEGTGLGLALSRRFVELHGGRLWVESEPGQGSTFTFTLPRNQPTGDGVDADGLLRAEAVRSIL